MSIIDVTSGQSFATVSAAISGSGSGDVIDIAAGIYIEDFPVITHALTLQGVGGLAQLSNPGMPPNGKGILDIGANVTIRSIDLSGAAVPSANGSGIRLESGNLTVIDSHIHNNDDGILTAGDPTSNVTILNSEIDHNGEGDGFSHNIYIGQIASLTISNSYLHDVSAGHEIKSRAMVNTIIDNRIQDMAGDASFSIDLPDGGLGTVTGNVLEKGANTQNIFYIHFGGELFPPYANSDLTITGNTFISELPTGADLPPYGLLNATNTQADGSGTGSPALVAGNTFYGFEEGGPILDAFAPVSTLGSNVFLPLSAAPTLDTSSPYAAVPEPGTAALLALALLGAWLLRRTRPIAPALG